MAVTITLNRQALLELVEKDPEFRLELNQTVLSQIVQKFFEKDIKRIVTKIEPALFTAAVEAMQQSEDLATLVRETLQAAITVRSNSWSNPRLSDQFKAEITYAADQVRDKLLASVNADFEKMYSAKIEEVISRRMNAENIEARIDNRMERLMEAEIERRVSAKLTERLAAIQAAAAGVPA